MEVPLTILKSDFLKFERTPLLLKCVCSITVLAIWNSCIQDTHAFCCFHMLLMLEIDATEVNLST